MFSCLRKSSDHGNNFDSIINLSNNEGWSDGVNIAASCCYAYIVWEDRTLSNSDVFFRVLKSMSALDDNDTKQR